MSSYTSPKVLLTTPFTRHSTEAESRSSAGGNGARSEKSATGGNPSHRLPPIGSAPIICLCHLSWDWVWQRPQQFLSRFSKKHPVLFVETYCTEAEEPFVKLRVAAKHPNLTIAEVHLPRARWHDGEYIDRERRFALQSVLDEELHGIFDHPILWFYDPMAVTAFAGQMNERLIVYDCMDELSQFKGAPPELINREQILLRKADVVFCGGRKMREKRLPLNANTHFYGTGVDIAHFGKARSKELRVAPEIEALKGPVLGYFGVIDERIDYDLLAKLADARDDWHIVMVGPTAKVDPSGFPQRPNLHWIGGRSYDQLPALTKGFNVCLMPFAINAATEYINPTKALEYMAAGRPVVSTAINEVKSNFSQVARIGSDHDEFLRWCVRECESPTHSRVTAGLRMAAENTWEAISANMEAHIADADAARAGTAAAARSAASSSTLPVQSSGLAYV